MSARSKPSSWWSTGAGTFLLLSLLAVPACAHVPRQDLPPKPSNEPPVPEKARKTLRAFPLTGAPPRIDGRLDEPVWARADSIDDLVQWEPDNLFPLSERTVIRLAYDQRFLYVAVRCYDREPGRIASGLGRREDFPPSDRIEIGFDPRHDHLTGYVFQTNPSGVQGDFAFFDDESVDRQYDAVWEVGTLTGDSGWVAEFRIPFSQMRFERPPGSGTVWGFEARRLIHRKGEVGQWVGRPRGERGQVSRWGHLVFAERRSGPRRVEILPFTAARRAQLRAAPEAEYRGDVGVDVRLGLGTSATLAATMNPDFGQVEVDPAVLNLSVFETFFPEKRPFFLEDWRTFVPPQELFRLFHSRRIGRRPGRLPLGSTDRLVARPTQTTILGAAKVTGKGAGWTYGALTALTAREYAAVDSLVSAAGGASSVHRVERLIEPLTSYSVARLQRDVRRGTSNVGGLVTAVVREGDADALAAGVDYKIRWDRNRFEWNGHWAVTHAPGAGGPRTGAGGVTNLVRSGKHVGFHLHVDHLGRDFRVNDLGFQRNRNDRTAVDAGLNLSQPDPWWVLRGGFFSLNGGQAWNADRLVFDRGAGAGLSLQFRNFWWMSANVFRSFETLDDLNTRGGPPIVRPAGAVAFGSVSSDSRKSWQLSVGVSGAGDAAGGRNARIAPAVSARASARLQTGLELGYSRGRDAAQWITNTDVSGDSQTDYVYGTLDRHVVDLTLRASYAPHRDLSLQLFLQPFVAVGDYTDIRRLARPRSFDFEPASIPFNPDFNSKSLRGNLVLRWEYLRGSTVFLVWSLSTFDDTRPGVFSPIRDLSATFAAPGTHILMIKANYWLGL